MSRNIDRRSLLKSGLLTLGGMAVAPHLKAGAFANAPLYLDRSNRIYRSPLLREHFLNGESFEKLDASKMIAKLNANENPYGPPAAAMEAVKESVNGGNRYAWRELYDLIGKIATKEGVKPENIMMGPGSSDLLEKVAIVLFKDGGNVVSADPSYMSLMNVAKSVGGTWKAVPCNDDWSHNLKAMEAAIDKDTKLVYICNPNNPVAMITPGKELEDFCSRVSEKVPVFIDEAYIELAVGADTKSMVGLLQKNKNVIIARTFSKIMGMAGLRVGYIAAQTAFLDQIQDITRGGMGIAFTSIAAASAALDDKNFQDNTRKLNHEAKQYLYASLDKMGYKYIPSYTNFVMFPITMDGKEYLKKMADKGVMVRSFDIHDKTYCRVSLGTMDEMKMFVSALQDVT
ncbi:histidinol-phosphate transaminase [Persicitalea sp.]|uniref:pyridoxal phosphate-dependent aminotransferase n=1 Tax=Persicitalea sp. TaxID=3100273 RepID=UPI0035931349